MGYWAYQNRDRTWDRRNVSAAVVGTLALFGAEGFLADSYLETPEGRAEAERAKKEGSRLYLKAKEVILRPNVFGGLAGLRKSQFSDRDRPKLTRQSTSVFSAQLVTSPTGTGTAR